MHRAHTTITTPKAARYLKALCNHFSHKVTAEYTDNDGTVQFGFADCTMQATDYTLTIHVEAETDENFGRVKYVVSDHLERFSGDEALKVIWEQKGEPARDD